MRKILSKEFFSRPTLNIAQDLLGKFLVRRVGTETVLGMITEVEAYAGFEDRASHAYRGKTPRTEVMFGKPGHWYVYLVYGMHCCLNIVTEKRGYPAAVLIRAVDHTVGPGRVCKKFKIDRGLNKMPAQKSTGLWIEDRAVWAEAKKVKKTPRIGVGYAGVWKNKPWRFVYKPL